MGTTTTNNYLELITKLNSAARWTEDKQDPTYAIFLKLMQFRKEIATKILRLENREEVSILFEEYNKNIKQVLGL